jgi:creatinine amidohydrolase
VPSSAAPAAALDARRASDPPAPAEAAQQARGISLEDLTWQQAESALTRNTVVVLPLGAAAKEHGPHLRLNNDWLMAEYLKRRVLEAADVVVAPTVNYSFYPAFVLYPGSTSLTTETARDMIVQICRSLAAFGPRKFYVLNTGISTLGPLRQAAAILAVDTIDMRFTNLSVLLADVEKAVARQEGGTHADEIETSMMLYMAPTTVDMRKAVKDYRPSRGRLVRDSTQPGTYSPTGIWGDPTLATREKGERVTEALVAGILRDIQALRTGSR